MGDDQDDDVVFLTTGDLLLPRHSQVTTTEDVGIVTPKYLLGQIKELHMINFMCHENFSIRFHATPMQLITGANGSGKSSIANAISLCLGAQARATGRTSNVQSFIRKGTRQARLTLILANEGAEAFKPEVYGREIHIIRKIGIRQSEYNIFSEKGQLISKSRKTIDDILCSLSISPENPLCVLHQDIAKTFLLNSDAQKKYQFYMKVSQLDQIKEAYEEGMVIVDSLSQRVDLMKEKHRVMLRDLEPLTQRVKHIDIRREKDAEKRLLEKELIALQNNQIQQEYVQILKMIQQAEGHRNDLKEHIENIEDLLQLFDQQANQYAIEKIEFEEDLRGEDGLKNLHQHLSKQKRDIESSVSNLTRQCQIYHEAITEIELEQIRIQQWIDQHEESDRRIVVQDYQRAELEEEISKRKSLEKQFDEQIDALTSDLQTIDQTLRVKQSSIEFLNNEFVREEEVFERLDRKKQNEFSVYGSWMSDCLKMIEDETRFHQRPIGPIGRHIRYLDRRWSLAIEKHLSSIMSSFICADNHDENLLIDIFSKFTTDDRPAISVFNYTDRVHDISGTLECIRRANLTSIYEILEISNVTVECFLIDNKKIDATILIEDFSEAMRIWRSGVLKWENVRGKVRRVVEARTSNGSTAKFDRTIRTYTNEDDSRQYFRTNHDTESLEEKMDQIKKSLNEQKQEFSDLSKDREKINQRLNVIKQNRADEKQRLQELAEKLIAAESSTLIDADHSIEDYIEQLAQSNRRRSETAERYVKTKDEKDQQTKLLNNLIQSNEILSEKIAIRIQQFELLTEKFNEEQIERRSYEETRIKTKLKLDLIEQQLSDYQNRLNQLKRQCDENGTTIDPTHRSIDDIQLEINTIENFLKTNEDTQEERRKVIEEFRTKRNATQVYEAAYQRCCNQIQRLKKFVSKRKERFLTIADENEYLVRYRFRHLMARYGFVDSDIIIDHNKEELNILIEQSSERFRRLSGGERSIATLCFLLALWESVYQPFRLIDEFDIYMDNQKRHSCLEILYETTRRYSSSQLIILTPQILDVERWNNLHVPLSQMPTPKRSLSIFESLLEE